MDVFRLHWSTIFGLASWQWTIILVPIALALMTRLGRLPARPRDGWHQLSPTIVGYAMVPLFLMMALFGMFCPILAFLGMPKTGLDFTGWGLIGLGPLIAVLGAYGFSYLALVRLRFNKTGVERRILGRRVFIAWTEVIAVKRHWFFGPRIICRNGKAYAVWEYLRGFRDFIESVKSHGISVEIEPSTPPRRS